MPKRPRDSSTVLLLRGTGSDLEVYLVDRNPKLRFFGGYQALPGGVLGAEDDGEGSAEDALRRCAVRETFEETGVFLLDGDAPADEEGRRIRQELLDEKPSSWQQLAAGRDGGVSRLRSLCRITTPPFAPVRYETIFWLAELGPDDQPEIWEGELVGGRFWRPADALAAWRRGEVLIVPPVLLLLQLLVDRTLPEFHEAAAAMAARYQGGDLHRVQFSPGVIMACLATPTLPPATTTNCLIIGTDQLYLVDPATPDPAEQQRLFDLLDLLRGEGRELAGVLLTHHHPDHVGAAEAVSQRHGLDVRGHELTLSRLPHLSRPGAPIADGDRIALGTAPDGSSDWELEAVFTPGHDRGHLCFLDHRYRALIAGDMISTVSTIIIDPPEGHLTTYMASLERLADLDLGTLYPAHGPAARDGNAVVKHFIAHRTKRQARVVEVLQQDPGTVEDLVTKVYDDTDVRMHPYALRSLLAGLQMLEENGQAVADSDGVWQRTAGGGPS